MLLTEMRPLALVILPYYGVALYAFWSGWHIADWGRQIILDVERTLSLANGEGDEIQWHELMTWLLEMVNNGEGLDKIEVNG